MANTYRVSFFTSQRRMDSIHHTKHGAMTAGYAHLDQAQRDCLALGDQQGADYFGKARGRMASEWQETVRTPMGRWQAVMYKNACLLITRED